MTHGPLRVLLADDDSGILRATRRLLLALEYDVVGTVADGHGLLDAVQRLRPEVVVLDVRLPDADGLDVCRRITGGNAEVKVIVFTATDHAEIRRRAFEAGAFAFVSKLASTNELQSAIRRVHDNRG
jgi:DNA-binding NarL/FixJ family response regulator